MNKSRRIFRSQHIGVQAAGDAIRLAVRGDPTARNEAAIRASALLLVTRGWLAATSPNEVNRLMPEGEWFRSARELRMATGGGYAVAKRLAAGGVIPLSSLGKWTPDFWAGLIMSGALRPSNRPRQWFMQHAKRGHSHLLAILTGDVPFRRSWAQTAHGVAFWSLWAANMGADDPESTGVLAGMWAGGRRVERRGVSWIGIAWRERNAALLDRHLIPKLCEGRQGVGTLLVSPFWGVLLSTEMPEGFGQWFRLWGGRKGMCPLLPWAFLAYAWGKYPGEKGKHRGMVPWAVGTKQMISAGIGIKGKRLRRLAFEQFGMRGVSPEVRAAWLRGLVARGVEASDFPEGKIPLDFESHLCHDIGIEETDENRLEQS